MILADNTLAMYTSAGATSAGDTSAGHTPLEHFSLRGDSLLRKSRSPGSVGEYLDDVTIVTMVAGIRVGSWKLPVFPLDRSCPREDRRRRVRADGASTPMLATMPAPKVAPKVRADGASAALRPMWGQSRERLVTVDGSDYE